MQIVIFLLVVIIVLMFPPLIPIALFLLACCIPYILVGGALGAGLVGASMLSEKDEEEEDPAQPRPPDDYLSLSYILSNSIEFRVFKESEAHLPEEPAERNEAWIYKVFENWVEPVYHYASEHMPEGFPYRLWYDKIPTIERLQDKDAAYLSTMNWAAAAADGLFGEVYRLIENSSDVAKDVIKEHLGEDYENRINEKYIEVKTRDGHRTSMLEDLMIVVEIYNEEGLGQ